MKISVPRRAFLWFPPWGGKRQPAGGRPFQYPEGHSSGFHQDDDLGDVFRMSNFSTPKGIPLVSTVRRGEPLNPSEKFQYPEGHSSGFHRQCCFGALDARRGTISVPRRAFLWFPLRHMRPRWTAERERFQYPEGHSSGFHQVPYTTSYTSEIMLVDFSTPKGIPLVSTATAKTVGQFAAAHFSTPKGIPLVSTQYRDAYVKVRRGDFSTPKGIPLVSTRGGDLGWPAQSANFSTPKGIPLVSTTLSRWPSRALASPSTPSKFQYPEGHSSGFHLVDCCGLLFNNCVDFSTPKGIPLVSTGMPTTTRTIGMTNFSTPKGIPLVSTMTGQAGSR